MADFGDIINHPSTGLLPYLDSQLAGDYARFLIRPYLFGSASLQSGIRFKRRLRDSTQMKQVTQSVLIGKMLVIKSDEQINSQLVAVRLAKDMEDAIAHWSECICPGLLAKITQFDGSFEIDSLRGVSSDQPNALWSVVIRSFEIQYLES